MKNPHLLSIPRSSGSVSSLLQLDRITAGGSQHAPAPAWLRSSLLWLVWNSPLPVPEKCTLQRQVQDLSLSQAGAQQLQQQLISRIHIADLARKSQLRERLVQRLVEYPEAFQQTHYGRDLARALVGKLWDETVTWQQLERADEQTDTTVQLYLEQYSWLHS